MGMSVHEYILDALCVCALRLIFVCVIGNFPWAERANKSKLNAIAHNAQLTFVVCLKKQRLLVSISLIEYVKRSETKHDIK